MAGGAGTRFWPLSRAARPKQLLALGNDRRSLLRLAFDRARALFPPERILVVTGRRIADAVAAQLPELPRARILAEPIPRSTAPCIAWAAARVLRELGDVPLAAVPSDQLIDGDEAYARAMDRAVALARQDWIVTFGLPSARPETGFGYVRAGEALGDDAFAVARFLEKPDRPTAERLIADGNVYWNSGMFVFSPRRMLDEIRSRLPETGRLADAVAGAPGEREADVVGAGFASCESISIDYAVLEKAPRVALVVGRFGWSDVGSWDAVAERAGGAATAEAGAAQAAATGPTTVAAEPLVILHGAPGAYVRAEAPARKAIAVVGVPDVVVVDTDDALLVCARGCSQHVRSVVDELAKRGKGNLV
jgi:mannose-1-phosphate guanylyltransferase